MSQDKSPVVKDLGEVHQRTSIPPQEWGQVHKASIPLAAACAARPATPPWWGFQDQQARVKGFLQINRARDSSTRRTLGDPYNKGHGNQSPNGERVKKPRCPLQSRGGGSGSVPLMIGQTGLPLGCVLVPLVTHDPAYPDDKLNRVIITGQVAAAGRTSGLVASLLLPFIGRGMISSLLL